MKICFGLQLESEIIENSWPRDRLFEYKCAESSNIERASRIMIVIWEVHQRKREKCIELLTVLLNPECGGPLQIQPSERTHVKRSYLYTYYYNKAVEGNKILEAILFSVLVVMRTLTEAFLKIHSKKTRNHATLLKDWQLCIINRVRYSVAVAFL